MTYPAALAITGAVLFFVATIAAIASTESYRHERKYATAGWILLAVAAAAEIGAAWWSAS